MKSKLAEPEFLPEFADNSETRSPCVLILDCSGSMAGEAIRELNGGIVVYQEGISKNPTTSLSAETAVVTFGGEVNVVQEFATIDKTRIPKLTAGGGTPMGEAITLALDLVEQRKLDLKATGIGYNTPLLFCLTDGAPTDDCTNAIKRVHAGDSSGNFTFFAVGIDGADMRFLNKLSPPSRKAASLNGFSFVEFFTWASDSVSKLAHSRSANQEIVLDPIDSWGTVHNSGD